MIPCKFTSIGLIWMATLTGLCLHFNDVEHVSRIQRLRFSEYPLRGAFDVF